MNLIRHLYSRTICLLLGNTQVHATKVKTKWPRNWLQISRLLFRKVSRVISSTASETGHVNSRRLPSRRANCTTAERQALPAQTKPGAPRLGSAQNHGQVAFWRSCEALGRLCLCSSSKDNFWRNRSRSALVTEIALLSLFLSSLCTLYVYKSSLGGTLLPTYAAFFKKCIIGIDSFSSRLLTAWQNDRKSSRSKIWLYLRVLGVKRSCPSPIRFAGVNGNSSSLSSESRYQRISISVKVRASSSGAKEV